MMSKNKVILTDNKYLNISMLVQAGLNQYDARMVLACLEETKKDEEKK